MMDPLTFIDILKKDEVLLELPATENDDTAEELGRASEIRNLTRDSISPFG
jgi:hypothetical protein